MSCSSIRIEALRKIIKKMKIDAFYVRNLSDIIWLTNFEGVFDDEPAHSLLVTANKIYLHTDARYSNACEQAAQGTEIHIDDSIQKHASFVAEVLKNQIKDGVRTLGIETSMSLAEYRSLEEALSKDISLAETKNIVLKMRSIKDSSEIKRLKAAQSITDATFSHMMDFIRPGMTERAVRLELENFSQHKGAEGLAFTPIVATGSNVANPHAIAGERALEPGHAVLMDFGAIAQGYCSDMTRMVFIGEPNDEIKRAYQAIRRANEEVVALIKPGVTGRALHDRAEAILEEEGFGNTMGHSLGHGVGIDVHELPLLAVRNKETLKAGNVVTVEPGIYVPGKFGMRLEDFGVVTPSGFEVFTQSTHDMVII